MQIYFASFLRKYYESLCFLFVLLPSCLHCHGLVEDVSNFIVHFGCHISLGKKKLHKLFELLHQNGRMLRNLYCHQRQSQLFPIKYTSKKCVDQGSFIFLRRQLNLKQVHLFLSKTVLLFSGSRQFCHFAVQKIFFKMTQNLIKLISDKVILTNFLVFLLNSFSLLYFKHTGKWLNISSSEHERLL